MAIDSSTGEIVAYVGSVDYYNRDDKRVQGQWDIAGVDRRQPGSAFKPITYSAAFQAREGTPATFFVDSVIQYGSSDPTQAYVPSNADLKDHGPLLALDGLHFSLNVPSVQMQYLVGEAATAEFAEKMGIASADYINNRDPGLTLTLGSVEVNPTNLTGAYGVFADEGTLHPATTIREIRDRNGRLIYNIADDGPQATHPMTPRRRISPTGSSRATPTRASIRYGAKTPRWWIRAARAARLASRRERRTTLRDVSAFGYVPGGLVTGVWMGNTNRDPLSNRVLGGLLSADGPMFLWQQFMTHALNNAWDWNDQAPSPNTNFDQPDGVVTASVCRYSGMAATGDCGPTITVPFLEGTVPPATTCMPMAASTSSRRCSRIRAAARSSSMPPSAGRTGTSTTSSSRRAARARSGSWGPRRSGLRLRRSRARRSIRERSAARSARRLRQLRANRSRPAPEAAGARSQVARAIPRSARPSPPFPRRRWWRRHRDP